jgi:hypothetical protein
VRILIEWHGWELSFGRAAGEGEPDHEPGDTMSQPVAVGKPAEDTSTFGLR